MFLGAFALWTFTDLTGIQVSIVAAAVLVPIFGLKLVDWKDAKVHFLTHALHYGTAIFEGIKCYPTPMGPAIFRLKDHLDRLYRSLRYVGIDPGMTTEEMKIMIREATTRSGGMLNRVAP